MASPQQRQVRNARWPLEQTKSKSRHPQPGAGAAHWSSHPHNTSSRAGSWQHQAIRYISHLLASGVCSVRSGHAHSADAMHNGNSPACHLMDVTLGTPVDDSTSRSPERQSIHRPFPKMPPAVLPSGPSGNGASVSPSPSSEYAPGRATLLPIPPSRSSNNTPGLRIIAKKKTKRRRKKEAKQSTGHLQTPLSKSIGSKMPPCHPQPQPPTQSDAPVGRGPRPMVGLNTKAGRGPKPFDRHQTRRKTSGMAIV